MQAREKVGKLFFQWFVAPAGRKVGSLKLRVRSHLARQEMKNCTPLWREAHFQIKICKAVPQRSTFNNWDVEKCKPLSSREAHFEAKMYKTQHARSTFGSWDVERVHVVVLRSTFRSQNVQNTPCSDHFWKLRCRKSARRCVAKHISKSNAQNNPGWNIRGDLVPSHFIGTDLGPFPGLLRYENPPSKKLRNEKPVSSIGLLQNVVMPHVFFNFKTQHVISCFVEGHVCSYYISPSTHPVEGFHFVVTWRPLVHFSSTVNLYLWLLQNENQWSGCINIDLPQNENDMPKGTFQPRKRMTCVF